MTSKEDGNDSKNVKKPWEFGRLLRTLTFYDVIKFPFTKRTNSLSTRPTQPGDVIWSTRNALGVEWGPLDDVVMGGASKSDLIPGKAFNGTWTGFTSTANNGGFAGIRTKLFQPPVDASRCRGFLLKLKGDGQRLKFIARDDDQWNGIAWSYSFDTKQNDAVEVKIPFAKLKPTRFAKFFEAGAPFNAKKVTGVQLTLSKFEYDGDLNKSFREGPFKMELQQLSFY